jgi:hypothetical protein
MSNTYEDRIATLHNFSAQHNAKIDLGAPGVKVDADAIVKHLQGPEIGALTVEGLNEVTADDLPAGLPRTVVRAIMTALRPPAATAERPACEAAPGPSPIVTASTAPAPQTIHVEMPLAADEMTDEALLAHYNPDRPQPKYDNELRKRYGSARVIVPAAGGLTVNVSATVERMVLVTKKRPLRETVVVDGKPVRPRMIGESLQREVVRENPLRPGTALCDPDASCPDTGESWAGIDLDAQRIVYLAVKARELVVTGTEDMRSVIRALREGGTAEAARRYQPAAARLAEMSESQKPSLELAPSDAIGGAARPPFRSPSTDEVTAYYNK